MKDEYKISVLNVAFLFVGSIMGAGFASGREIWQFFGVFGSYSYIGILAVGLLFIAFGIMSVVISQNLQSANIAKIILPFESKGIEKVINSIIVFFLFLVYMTMSSAGGALFQEQFGFNKIVGGLILLILVVCTVLGGFERISKYFKYIVPMLLSFVFLICLYIILADFPVPGREATIEVSPMAPTWYFATIIYISYNMLPGIIILSSSTEKAKTKKTTLLGAGLGGLLLGSFAFIMNHTLLTDRYLASHSVLPILTFSDKIYHPIRIIYAILLLAAVYVTATSNFYGLVIRLKEGHYKKYIIIGTAILGFLLGLLGFSNIVAWVLPFEGYFGGIFLLFMTIHFIMIIWNKKSEKYGIKDSYCFQQYFLHKKKKNRNDETEKQDED